MSLRRREGRGGGSLSSQAHDAFDIDRDANQEIWDFHPGSAPIACPAPPVIPDDFGQRAFDPGMLVTHLSKDVGLGQLTSRLILGVIVIFAYGTPVFRGQFFHTALEQGTGGTLATGELKDPGWTCSHESGYIWEEISPHPSYTYKYLKIKGFIFNLN